MAKTDAETLLMYADKHPAMRSILEFRANSKACSTFFDKYERLATPCNEADGQLAMHPDFRQWGTITNRFSCATPNMQQVSNPETTNSRAAEFVVGVREAFVPRPEHVLLCGDYDQLEVIVFADVSGEPTMLEAIRRGEDIHTAVTERIWGGDDNPKSVPAMLRALNIAKHRRAGDAGFAKELLARNDWKIVDAQAKIGIKLQRKLAKAVTFTKIFGGGCPALMGWINVGYTEAKAILSDYDSRFPVMRIRMKEMERQGRLDGHLINSFGLRVQVDLHRAYAGINWRVQSDAACLMKLGMRKCGDYLAQRRRDEGLRAWPVMTIHDELVFEVYRRHVNLGLARELATLMEDHEGAFRVKTPVSMEIARDRWSHKDKFDFKVIA
jgi:DNA polymerase-1